MQKYIKQLFANADVNVFFFAMMEINKTTTQYFCALFNAFLKLLYPYQYLDFLIGNACIPYALL